MTVSLPDTSQLIVNGYQLNGIATFSHDGLHHITEQFVANDSGVKISGYDSHGVTTTAVAWAALLEPCHNVWSMHNCHIYAQL